MISTSVLHTFLEIANTKSIKSTAKKLHCSSSNVTVRIQTLEKAFGAKLIKRRYQTMELTQAGKLAQHHIEKALLALEKAQQAVNTVDAQTLPLRFGSTISAASHRVSALLASVNNIFPEAQLTISVDTSAKLLKAVVAKKLDAALVIGKPADNLLLSRFAFSEEMDVLSSPDQRQSKPGSRLPQICHICSPDYEAFAAQWSQEQDRFFEPSIRVGTLANIVPCVTSGLSVALLPKLIVQGSSLCEQLTIETPSETFQYAEYYLIKRLDTPWSPTMRLLFEHQ